MTRHDEPNGSACSVYAAVVRVGRVVRCTRTTSETLASGRGLLIYEDHGKDASHEVTDYLLSRGTLEVYYWGGEDLRRVESLSQLQSIKRFRWLGYNFFCCRRGGVADQLLLACFGNPR